GHDLHRGAVVRRGALAARVRVRARRGDAATSRVQAHSRRDRRLSVAACGLVTPPGSLSLRRLSLCYGGRVRRLISTFVPGGCRMSRPSRVLLDALVILAAAVALAPPHSAAATAPPKAAASSAPKPATKSAASAAAKGTPTVDEARRFIAAAEAKLMALSIEGQRADWVKSTYITDDTEELSALANQRLIEANTALAKQATRFDKLELPGDVR